jgi:hypothetical protein
MSTVKLSELSATCIWPKRNPKYNKTPEGTKLGSASAAFFVYRTRAQ